MSKTNEKARSSGISSHTKHQTGGIEIVCAHSSATLPNGQVNSGPSSVSRARKVNPRSRSQHLFPFLKAKEKKKNGIFPRDILPTISDERDSVFPVDLLSGGVLLDPTIS